MSEPIEILRGVVHPWYCGNFGHMEIRDYERMELVGQLSVQGNLPCLPCREWDDCERSCDKMMFWPDIKTADIGFTKVENQK